jgi:rfaE bifunctional protein kinase chain/domain/rfaE bifunctional protein nucleotidyltransferase chain/domain
MTKKIIQFDKLSLIRKNFKSKKIVLCHGVFDVLHFGHIKHLQAAKEIGDILIVSITSDKFVNKGPGRPFFKLEKRLETISALGCVDYVVNSNFPDALSIIKSLKPEFYCKGVEYKKFKDDITGKILKEKKAIESHNGTIVYTNEEVYSSSKLIKDNINFHTSQNKFLRKNLSHISFKTVEKILDNFKKLNILLIGESIIDEYIFCDPVGKSGKESVLVFKELKSEKYIGGSLAIANTLANFCKSVTLITCIGEKKEFLPFIKKNLKKNIKLKIIYKKSSPTIIKKRFVDNIDNRKILGVYSINSDHLDNKDKNNLNKIIVNSAKQNDFAIIADYGHGFISKQTSEVISKIKKFKSLNAQLNSFNIGDHSLQKYSAVESIVINESELRHELRNQIDEVELLMLKLLKNIKFRYLLVTKGKDGAILYDSKLKLFFNIPAFGSNVKDKIGAGDNMLSLVSMAIFNKNDLNLSLLLGSIASAYSVSTLANKDIISRENILKTLKHLL